MNEGVNNVPTGEVIMKEADVQAALRAMGYNNVADSISFYKDEHGNYPYLVAGLGKAGGATIETDPFLSAGDIVVGNAQNYILNFNEGLRVDKEIKVQPRRVVYGGYLIADGNKKPGAFVFGQLVAATEEEATEEEAGV